MRRLSDVDLRLLRIFSTIVDCNGFRNAQIALNMAQSTLSKHLTTLDARLGSRLCERGRGGFRLTLEGEETYRAAQDLMRAVRPREWSLRSRFTAAYAPDTGAQALKADFIECLLSAIRKRSGTTL